MLSWALTFFVLAVIAAIFGFGGIAASAVGIGKILFFGFLILAVASALMGMVIPTTSVLALEEHGAIAGTASALLGTLQMLTGAVMMGVVGQFADGTPLPMVIGMTSGVLMAASLSWLTLGGQHRAAGVLNP